MLLKITYQPFPKYPLSSNTLPVMNSCVGLCAIHPGMDSIRAPRFIGRNNNYKHRGQNGKLLKEKQICQVIYERGRCACVRACVRACVSACVKVSSWTWGESDGFVGLRLASFSLSKYLVSVYWLRNTNTDWPGLCEKQRNENDDEDGEWDKGEWFWCL